MSAPVRCASRRPSFRPCNSFMVAPVTAPMPVKAPMTELPRSTKDASTVLACFTASSLISMMMEMRFSGGSASILRLRSSSGWSRPPMLLASALVLSPNV